MDIEKAFQSVLPKPYSNIYPPDDEECCHYICYSPSAQPGGGRAEHQPVFTLKQMYEMFMNAWAIGYKLGWDEGTNG